MGFIGRGFRGLWSVVVYFYELIGWIFAAGGATTVGQLKAELRETNRDLRVLQEQLKIQRDEARARRLEGQQELLDRDGDDPAAREGELFGEDGLSEDDDGGDDLDSIRGRHGEALSQCQAHGPLNMELQGGGFMGLTRWRVLYAMLYDFHLLCWTDRDATDPFRVIDLRSAERIVKFEEEEYMVGLDTGAHGRLLFEAPSEDDVETWVGAFGELLKAVRGGEYDRQSGHPEQHREDAAVAGAQLAKFILNPPNHKTGGFS